jgi:hypothetical protein
MLRSSWISGCGVGFTPRNLAVICEGNARPKFSSLATFISFFYHRQTGIWPDLCRRLLSQRREGAKLSVPVGLDFGKRGLMNAISGLALVNLGFTASRLSSPLKK